jgi:hypothetical protein
VSFTIEQHTYIQDNPVPVVVEIPGSFGTWDEAVFAALSEDPVPVEGEARDTQFAIKLDGTIVDHV